MAIPTFSRIEIFKALFAPQQLRQRLKQAYIDNCDLMACRQSLEGAQEQNDLLREMLADVESKVAA